MKFGGLKCAACGADLELSISFDGMSENAVQFRKYDSEWGYVVHLNCTKCPRTYPICRTPNANYISEEK